MSCNYGLNETYGNIQTIEELPKIDSMIGNERVLGNKLIKSFDSYDVYEVRTLDLFYGKRYKYLCKIQRGK